MHLQRHTVQTLELTRIYDFDRFSTDEVEEDWKDDSSRKLRLTVLNPPPSSDNVSTSSSWLRLSDLLSQGFKYSTSTKPTAAATKKQLVHDLSVYLKRHCVTQPFSAFVAKFKGKDFISEPALCILGTPSRSSTPPTTCTRRTGPPSVSRTGRCCSGAPSSRCR